MKPLIYVFITALILCSCQPQSEQTPSDTEVRAVPLEQQTLKKIDVHTHFRYDRNYLPSFFEKWNMQGILVDVAKQDPAGIQRSWEGYVALAHAHPEVFGLCSSLIGVGIDDPGFAEKEIARLESEIQAGALMVKVWKNFGMVTQDNRGNFIQIDDERLQPIWDFLVSKDIPVMAHIGEPIQAWRPLDDPHNPHYGYYTDHPEYHAFQHPEIPSYETIMAARDRWIARNPNLQILCAHMGSMSHDVDMIAERLDKYPNMYVEPAARFGDLAGQDSEKVRAFFEKYQDRIFFGTDFGSRIHQDSLSAEALQSEQSRLNHNYEQRWKYLSSTDSLEIRNQKTRGLALAADILHKVYYQNVVDFLQWEK